MRFPIGRSISISLILCMGLQLSSSQKQAKEKFCLKDLSCSSYLQYCGYDFVCFMRWLHERECETPDGSRDNVCILTYLRKNYHPLKIPKYLVEELERPPIPPTPEPIPELSGWRGAYLPNKFKYSDDMQYPTIGFQNRTREIKDGLMRMLMPWFADNPTRLRPNENSYDEYDDEEIPGADKDENEDDEDHDDKADNKEESNKSEGKAHVAFSKKGYGDKVQRDAAKTMDKHENIKGGHKNSDTKLRGI